MLEAWRAERLLRQIGHKGSLGQDHPTLAQLKFCLEGYPRSANTMAIHLLGPLLHAHYQCNKSVIHHTHDARALKLARLLGLPTLLLLREPAAAVASNLVYHGGRFKAADLLRAWCRYYQQAERQLDGAAEQVLVCRFETVVNDLNQVIRALQQRFALALPAIADVDERLRQMHEVHLAHSVARKGEHYYEVIPLPSSEREAHSAPWRAEVQALDLGPARAIYERVLRRAI